MNNTIEILKQKHTDSIKELEIKINQINGRLLEKYNQTIPRIEALDNLIELENKFIHQKNKEIHNLQNSSDDDDDDDDDDDLTTTSNNPFIYPSFNNFNKFELELLNEFKTIRCRDSTLNNYPILNNFNKIKLDTKKSKLKLFENHINSKKKAKKSKIELKRSIKENENNQRALIKQLIISRSIELKKLLDKNIVKTLINHYIDNKLLLSNYNLYFFFDNDNILKLKTQILNAATRLNLLKNNYLELDKNIITIHNNKKQKNNKQRHSKILINDTTHYLKFVNNFKNCLQKKIASRIKNNNIKITLYNKLKSNYMKKNMRLDYLIKEELILLKKERIKQFYTHKTHKILKEIKQLGIKS